MSGLLYKTKCYLAGNIENTNGNKWRDSISLGLKNMGIISLDPKMPIFIDQIVENEETQLKLKLLMNEGLYNDVSDFMKNIIRRDLRMIDISDFVIINLETEQPTFGTIHELVIASLQRKPIFLCVPNKNKTPLWIMGLINHDCIYENLDAIIQDLNQINNREKQIDTKYWKLVTREYR